MAYLLCWKGIRSGIVLEGYQVWNCAGRVSGLEFIQNTFDVHGSVHHNTKLIEITNKMWLCSRIYYSNIS